MNPFLERQLLLISNPELKALQIKIDSDTVDMTPLEKCEYLQELMISNCLEIGDKLQVIVKVSK